MVSALSPRRLLLFFLLFLLLFCCCGFVIIIDCIVFAWYEYEIAYGFSFIMPSDILM